MAATILVALNREAADRRRTTDAPFAASPFNYALRSHVTVNDVSPGHKEI
jgi:hypothetical protein